MRNAALLLLGAFLNFSAAVSAQQTKGAAPVATTAAKAGRTWAVIVGVSDYQESGITDLQYAHRDAAAFAQYLQSAAGGDVDAAQVRLLLNQDATLGKVAEALDWLLEVATEGDLAIIYFSGHGDVERKTISQPGYLLCWDAPARVYYGGGALGLPMFQKIISTLSLQNKARVLVVTDACRAGKLAGSEVGGIQITATNLARQYANEVKILSCRPEELSLEGTGWGGGRGVFSYYFLNGLTGLADRNNDGTVTVQEIERYLEDWVPKTTDPHSQNPFVIGNKSTPIGRVDPAALAALKQDEESTDWTNNWAAVNDKGILSALEKDPGALSQYNEFKKALKEGNLLTPEGRSAWNLYEALKDKTIIAPFQSTMRRNLAAALQDEAQQAMNAYLKSDAAELRKRWKYADSHYENFPLYLEKAADLLGDAHPLYKNLKARAHYFTALNYRLRGEKTKTPSLYNLALAELQKGLKYEWEAAFIYNERGLLNRRLKQPKQAVEDFERAYSLSPNWVLPWANLAAIYDDRQDYSNAEIAGKHAVQLDSAFALAQYNLGVTYHFSDNPTAAKMHYHQAIRSDAHYALAYFNLGLLYYHENNWEQAETLWIRYAELEPGDAEIFVNLGEVARQRGQKDVALKRFKKALELDPKLVQAQLCIGQLYLAEEQYDKAESAFWRYAAQQPDDPIPYYYLAYCKDMQGSPEMAAQQLKKARSLNKYQKALSQDPTLDMIRDDPRFHSLLKG